MCLVKVYYNGKSTQNFPCSESFTSKELINNKDEVDRCLRHKCSLNQKNSFKIVLYSYSRNHHYVFSSHVVLYYSPYQYQTKISIVVDRFSVYLSQH